MACRSYVDRLLGIIEVAVDGGKAQETDLFGDWSPARMIALASGLPETEHTVVIRCTGRKSEKATGIAAWLSRFEVRSQRTLPAGWVMSEPIACAPDLQFPWRYLHFGAAQPEGTRVQVDVLDGAGTVLLADVKDGSDLGAVKSPVIQLRARLTASAAGVSPRIAYWQVGYYASPSSAGTGCVVNAQTGKPVAGAEVVMRRFMSRPERQFRFTSSATGGFALTKAMWGVYDVSAAARGLLPMRARTVAISPRGTVILALFPPDALGARLKAWSVPAMQTVFPDTLPPDKREVTLRLAAAANEYEPAQLALRASLPVGRVRVSATALKQEKGAFSIPESQVRARFVGYVPVPVNSPDVPPGELARETAGYYPDPLLPAPEQDLPVGRTQSVWLTVRVPADAPAGEYKGVVKIETALGAMEVPVALTVWPFRLTDESHMWFGHGCIGWGTVVGHYAQSGTEEDKWRVIKMALRDKADHRKNVQYLDGSVFDMCHITFGADGKWKYDFRELDQWVQAVKGTYPHGKLLIEGACFASRGGWTASEVMFNGCSVYNDKG